MSTPQTAIETQEKLPVAVAIPTPMSILEIAVRQNADIEKLAKLMDLQERWEKREAEKRFTAALAAFKKHPPDITKNKKVSYTNRQGQLVEYRHATLDRVTGAIAAGLGEHGISADWKTTQENGKIRVTCFLQHELGHREERASLEGPPDDSGSKNSVQAVASTVTFLERYTLLAATGLATRDDADGITFSDVEDSTNSLLSAITLDELQDRFNRHYKRAHAAKDKASMAILIETKDQRKKQLLEKNPKADEQMKEFQRLAEEKGLNRAGRDMILGKHQGNLEAAIAELKEVASPPPTQSNPKGSQPEDAGMPQEEKRSAKRGGKKAGTEVQPGTLAQNPAAEPTPPSKDSGPDEELGF